MPRFMSCSQASDLYPTVSRSTSLNQFICLLGFINTLEFSALSDIIFVEARPLPIAEHLLPKLRGSTVA